MIDPSRVTTVDPPPGGEHLNIMISECGTKMWVCIDGVSVLRYRNLKSISIEDLRDTRAPHTALVAAKLSGRMTVVLGIGRLDHLHRFQPLGQTEVDATVYQESDGRWFAGVTGAKIPYQYSWPRHVTHVGMFIHNEWLTEHIPGINGGHLMNNRNDVTTFTTAFPLPETL